MCYLVSYSNLQHPLTAGRWKIQISIHPKVAIKLLVLHLIQTSGHTRDECAIHVSEIGSHGKEWAIDLCPCLSWVSLAMQRETADCDS